MKNTVLLCITLLWLLTLNAQNDYWKEIEAMREANLYKDILPNEEFFEKAELVIEGRILKTFDSYDAKGNYNRNDIYTIQAILVQWVYKGDVKLTNDTIYVVRHFGTILRNFTPNDFEIITMPEIWEDDNGTADPGINLDRDYSNILFFVKSDFPENPEKSSYSNKPKYKFLQDKEKAVLRVREKIIGLNNLIFNNREELYQYMKQFKGYVIPAIALKKPVREYNENVIDSAQYEIIKAKWDGDKKNTE
jgi:hypothetical protein